MELIYIYMFLVGIHKVIHTAFSFSSIEMLPPLSVTSQEGSG